MLCIMWNSKHFWLQVNRTSSAYNLYRRNSMEDFAKSLKYVYLRIILWVPLFLEFFASHSICTTVAWVTSRWVKFVEEVGSTIFDWNSDCIFATVRTIPKADLPFNFTIFHCSMSIIQLTWPFCTTSVCWHTHFWQFPPNDTIPEGVGGHTTLNRKVLRNLSFYEHHSGFYNDCSDRLQKEVIIATGV